MQLVYIYIYIYIYMQNWPHPVDLGFVYICQPCQIQKYHRGKRFVLYMYSIQDGSQQYSVTLYSELTSYNISIE